MPAESLILDGREEITEETLEALRQSGEDYEARTLDARIRHLDGSQKRTFLELGMIAIEMEDGELYKRITDPSTGEKFKSMGRWIMAAAPTSRSNVYASMDALRKLSDIPLADLRDVPRCNISTLAELSTSVRRDPEILDAAKTKSNHDFIAEIVKEFPGQGMEFKQKLVLSPAATAMDVYERAYAAMAALYGVKKKEDATEMIFVSWLDSWCEIEECKGLTNEQAAVALLASGRL